MFVEPADFCNPKQMMTTYTT